MKINVTVGGDLTQVARSRRLPGTLSARVRRQLSSDVEAELNALAAQNPGTDPDPQQRRDALERAVRRVWGTTL